MSEYGFEWGPMKVQRLAHIEPRGYVLEVRTDHASMEVFVSEEGRVVRAYDPGQIIASDWRKAEETVKRLDLARAAYGGSKPWDTLTLAEQMMWIAPR